MKRSTLHVISAAAAAALAGGACGAPPPFTLTSVAQSGNIIPGSGVISLPGAFGPGQGRGVLKVAVNNSGAWLVDVHVVQTDTTIDQALLRSTTGLAPYIAEGIAGYLQQPTPDHIANGFHSISLNNAGNAGLAMGLFDDEFAQTNPSSAVFFNRDRVVALEGDAVATAGLAPGTTWLPFAADSVVRLVDTGRVLIVSRVLEKGIARRVVMVAQVDGSGNVVSRTLVAKEGGPVGVGPDTWASISGGGHASAMNDSGTVAFSGVTTGGTNGVYSSAAGFVAVQGGPSPLAGVNWGVLAGSPVDINNSGTVAIRGILANGTGVYNESELKDAGEGIDTADRTFGNGPLTLITGTLDNDHDVDMYRIVVADSATFSATTVPDPGTGFAGATWNTVLTLIASPENGTRGRVRCDDVSPSVPQSTLTGSQTVSGREYYVCVSTPKASPRATVWHYATGSFPNYDIWLNDPAGLAAAGGRVMWPDPSLGTISLRTTAGVDQPAVAAAQVSPYIAADGAAGKVYWVNRGGTGGPKILRANFDGTAVEELVTTQGFGTITASDATGLALDTVNGKLYWSRSVYGEINRCDLNGANQERVLRDYPPTGDAFPAGDPTGTLAPSSLAVHAAIGRVYWVNAFLDRIEHANFNGTGRTTLGIGAGATSLAIDSVAGKMYWTNTAAGLVQRANLDGSGVEDVVATPGPTAIALDVAGGRVYWTNTAERVVRSATLAGSGTAQFASVAAETGQNLPDGPGTSSAFNIWSRTGTASGPALPYQVRLTGATFRHENALISRGNQKVVATGDVIPGTSPHRITVVGSAAAPIQISDRGDVMWVGEFAQPTPYNNYLFDALFWNGERLMAAMDTLPGVSLNSQKLVNLYRTAYSLSQSRSGAYAMVAVNMQDPPYNFSPQRDNALVIAFDLPSACRADFDQSGTVAVPDIFAFLSAWFASQLSADFDGNGTVAVPDIFAFLSAWFAGCP